MCRRDTGHARSECLLQRLAEGFVHAGVHEHVETGEVLGELLAGEKTREDRFGHQSSEPFALGSITNDHQSNARIIGEHGQIFDAFLVGETPDVTHHDSTIGVPAGAQCVAALVGREQLAVDAAAPHRHVVDAVRVQVLDGCR